METVQEVSENLKDLSMSAQKVQDEVIKSMRGSIEHFKYATPRVQLAWGLHTKESRIKHVASVDNGRKCACICPACREDLVSRQGAVLAWHFAHHDGKECRNAVSAAMAKFLAQWLSDGNGLDLPKVKYNFGGQYHSRPARKGMTFDRAVAKEDPDSKAWEVIAEVGEGDKVSKLRILIRTNPRMQLPSKEACREADVSTMVIEVGSVLSVALEIDPDLCTDENWVTSQVVSEAPRQWLWTAAADRLRQASIEKHVVPYLSAIEIARAKVSKSTEPSAAEKLIEVLGYDAFTAPPQGKTGTDIKGALIFNHPPRGWRSEVFLDLVLRPIAHAHPKAPEYKSTVIGWRQSGATCRKRSLVPPLFLKRMDASIMLELGIAVPGYEEPVKVIDRYLEDLADNDVLRRRPRRRNQAWQTDKYDPDLKFIKGGSYSISPVFIALIRDHLSKHPEDREAILQGRLP